MSEYKTYPAVDADYNFPPEIRQAIVDSPEASSTFLTRVAADAVYADVDSVNNLVPKNELVVNVKDHGAVGDGIVDDGAAIQAAIDFAWGSFGYGGTVLIPAGKYNVLPRLRLRSNVNYSGYGATLTKNSTAAGYAVFHSRSDGNKGYGSGDSNILVEGLKFEGSFADGRFICAFALHHSDNVKIVDCTFTQCISTAHIIDMCGSSNVEITRCTFEGYLNAGGGYAKEEAIQIDLSIAGSASATDADGSWDGLPTKNVKVHNNRFLPLVLDGMVYPAPNPIGSHAILEGAFYEGIVFEENYILDPLIDITSDVRGVVHFIGLANSRIKNNTFEFSSPKSGTMIGLYSADWGTRKNGAQFEPGTTNTPGAITPLNCKNVTVEKNIFKGFGNTLGAGQIIISPHAGGTTTCSAENVKLLANEFYLTSVASAATNFIEASYVDGLVLDEMNIFVGPGRPLNSTNIKNLTIGKNRSTGARADAFRLDTGVGIKITGLEANGCAGTAIYLANAEKVNLSQNTVESLASARAIALNKVKNFNVDTQIVTAPSGVFGIQVYGASSYGRVTSCNINGGTTTHVNISTDSNTTVTESGNLKMPASV